MTHNVGRKERFVRLAIGAIAGTAAMRVQGWQRSALCGVATSGFLTGLTRYCPLNAALGVNSASRPQRISRHDEYVRNVAIRRETQTAGAMGQLPGTSVQPEPIAG